MLLAVAGVALLDFCQMGGKKKGSARKPPKKVVKRLAKAFKCPFCDHEGTVEVKMYVKML